VKRRRVLISGASGLVGLTLALEAAKEHEVYGVVNQRALKTNAFSVQQVDLLAPGAAEQLFETVQPDWMIHCAALANLEACEAQPEYARQVNAQLPGRLASLAARGNVRFMHISTVGVFDGQRGNYGEGDPPFPLSVYARTKLEGEYAVAQANARAVVARINLFGWSLTGRRSLAEFFVYNLAAGKAVKGFTDVFFCPLLVNDLARILLEMLDKNLSGLYHVFSADCISKYDFGVQIARQFNLNESLITACSVEEGGLVAARAPRLTMRTEKLVAALGHELPSVAQGIQRLYELYLQGYAQRIRQMMERDT